MIYIDHLSQMTKVPEQGLKEFKLSGQIQGSNQCYGVGNDTFICTKNNPLMKKMIEKAEANYENPEIALKIAYCSHDIKGITIEKTGPTVVSDAISDAVNKDIHFIKNVENMDILIFPVRTNTYELTKPLKNFKDWLDVPLTIPDNIEDTYDIILSTIEFEIKHLKIIRLNDHINNIKRIAKKMMLDEQECVKKFMIKLNEKGLNYTEVNIAQMISTDEIVFDFYQQKGLNTKTCITQETDNKIFKKIALWITSSELFCTLNTILSANEFDQLILNGIYVEQQVSNFANQIQIGMDFIEKMIKEDTFKKLGIYSDKNELSYNFCGDLIEYYIVVAQKINTYFEKEHIDINNIQNLKIKVNQYFEENKPTEEEQEAFDREDAMDLLKSYMFSSENNAVSKEEIPKKPQNYYSQQNPHLINYSSSNIASNIPQSQNEESKKRDNDSKDDRDEEDFKKRKFDNAKK